MNTIDIALICKALGDQTRLQIVQMLSSKEICACKLLDKFEITQPTLSHHMKTLCECGLVSVRKEGKWCHYSLNCETLSAFRQFIGELFCGKEGVECC
ncbi:MAG: helix-turn-helix transcriptional regulator [Eubacteriaceae bacterium]|nr:helix-turn-helix transcriptional regulator [Eubacteriaceae bacterium]